MLKSKDPKQDLQGGRGRHREPNSFAYGHERGVPRAGEGEGGQGGPARWGGAETGVKRTQGKIPRDGEHERIFSRKGMPNIKLLFVCH